MPTDDEIRTLCLRVLQAKGDEDFDVLLGELRAALTEHCLEIENLGIHLILNAPKRSLATETPVLASETPVLATGTYGPED